MHAKETKSRTVYYVDGQDSAVAIRKCFQFPISFQLRPSLGKLNAARSIAFRVLCTASQASDVASIPIAPFINPMTQLILHGYVTCIRPRKLACFAQLLDGSRLKETGE